MASLKKGGINSTNHILFCYSLLSQYDLLLAQILNLLYKKSWKSVFSVSCYQY